MEFESQEDRTRTWGIVLMGLLTAVLAFFLLRTRAPESPSIPESPGQESRQGATSPSQEPSEHPSGAAEYYRGWPLFEGWPLPQLPSGSEEAPPPEQHAPEQKPPTR